MNLFISSVPGAQRYRQIFLCEWMGGNLSCWGQLRVHLSLCIQKAPKIESEQRALCFHAVAGKGGKACNATIEFAGLSAKYRSNPFPPT